MLASPNPTPTRPGVQPGGRRRARHWPQDVLVLAAILALGAAAAFAAGIVVMPSASRQAGPTGAPSSGASGASGVAGGTGPTLASSDPASSPVATGPVATAPSQLSGNAPASVGSLASFGGKAPWRAWRPSGHGQEVSLQLPAPWTGGTPQDVTVVVYLPPGYATSTRTYPVVYEAPFSAASFDSHVGMQSILDSQITSGAFPASIVVYVHPIRGPFYDTECANSLDGRQQLDTFLATTLVHAIDARFRTIPTAAGLSTMGFSQGGYCAAMLALRHPDVFSTALAVSGYYQAGILNRETPDAWRVFGGNSAYEAAYSPLLLVRHLPAAQRATTLLILEANPAQAFYGPQYAAMLAAARTAGVGAVGVPEAAYHSWAAVRLAMPRMLRLLATHEVALGVFG